MREAALVTDSSGVRTFLVFRDLPYHYEHRAGSMPLLPEGVLIDFEARIPDQKSPGGVRDVRGRYRVDKRKLVYSTRRPSRLGLSQYLELIPAG